MILQFGKTPPPIGGISLHVSRLLSGLSSTLNVELLDYSRERNLFKILKKIIRNKIVHIHLSKKPYRLLFIILFRLIGKKVIVTFHGECNFKNTYDYLSIVICNYAIVLNEKTYSRAKKIKTNNLSIIGAHLPFKINSVSSIPHNILEEIDSFIKIHEVNFCTNAWNAVYDTDGNEIYGGSMLVQLFSLNSNIGLIFSDPAGNYKKYLLSKHRKLPENILFLNFIHDYIDIIPLCDASIRPTTTDGDALSVHESLSLNRDVLASNVVDRPLGCIIYNSTNELAERLNNFKIFKGIYKEYKPIDNLSKIKNVYLKLLNQ